MVSKLIAWALDNPLIVIVLALVLVVCGGYSFFEVNVEAYPDPAPAIIEVVAQYPGFSAEEIERQVTIPIEVALAGMPGLTSTRSKSLFGLSHLRNQFEYSVPYEKARQEVINRLQQAQLPSGVNPIISPASPIGEIYRYVLRSPRDNQGKSIYTLGDLKALQDWSLQREFLRVPRISGVVSSGGVVKRYEVRPDPERMRQYGITLAQVQKALGDSNANVGGDSLVQGATVQVVRGLGLLGGGQDPMQHVLTMHDPREAASFLRSEEMRRIQDIRHVVLASVNNVPVCIDHIVDGGPLGPKEEPGVRGVVVSHQTRQGRVSMSRPVHDQNGNERRDDKGELIWSDDEDLVQAIILLRKGQESIPALADVQAKIRELNETPGKLLPGVKIEPYYNRSHLIGLTTETVRENLLVGLVLVTMILLMFLNNVRTALIVALNIPLALLFAFAVLFLRGKSANLLSIGAVDFGIIVDSTVIMVENIYRHLTVADLYRLPGEVPEPLWKRILKACLEVERCLFFSTIIMVCALLPLFTMKGPEGQIFGPMADTYAFALGGALLLALTVSPVMCLLCFRHLQPAKDNILVRWLKRGYLAQLNLMLSRRWATLAVFGYLLVVTLAVLPVMGREFMPELEEGNLYIRGIFPINTSLDNVSERVRTFREVMRGFPEVESVVPQIGRPDDGTDPGGLYNVESFVPLRPQSDWPVPRGRTHARTKNELVREIEAALEQSLPGIDWDFSQVIRDNVMESLSGVKGENSIKIFGPDLDELERLSRNIIKELAPVRDDKGKLVRGVRGVEDLGVYRMKGQSNLEFAIDRARCQYWGINVADVLTVIESAIGGKACTQMREGEKSFDITLRWPPHLRGDLESIRNIPVDIVNNTIAVGSPSMPGTPLTGAVNPGISALGTTRPPPTQSGSPFHLNDPTLLPQRRLGDLLIPLNAKGQPDPRGQFIRGGASTISRDQGQRFIAVKFRVGKDRDLASTVAEAQKKVAPLLEPPYRAEWDGEFREMEEAEHRLLIVVSISLVLIFFLLYLAFHSLLDALVVYGNVLVMSMGGVWALLLTGTNFNVSAAVGFISILGVSVMNGLLLVSSFNQLRKAKVPLEEAIRVSMANRIRPLTMTCLTAILGLLPAALSTRIGAQSQRPLAIVVVGGMITTMLMTNLIPVLYSFYGQREPDPHAGGMAH